MAADDNRALFKAAFFIVIPSMFLVGGLAMLIRAWLQQKGIVFSDNLMFLILGGSFAFLIGKFMGPINRRIASKRKKSVADDSTRP